MDYRYSTVLRNRGLCLRHSSGRRETPESIAEAKLRASLHRLQQTKPDADELTTQAVTRYPDMPPDVFLVNNTSGVVMFPEEEEESVLDNIPVLAREWLMVDVLPNICVAHT